MSALEILRKASSDTRVYWSETSMLQIMSDYIDNHCDHVLPFEDYVYQRAREENEESDEG